MPDAGLLKVLCPFCNKRLGIRPDQQERRVRCPKCQLAFHVGKVQQPAEPASENNGEDAQELRPPEEWFTAGDANEIVLAGPSKKPSAKAKLTARFPRSTDYVYLACVQAIRSSGLDLIAVDKNNLHLRFAISGRDNSSTEHDLFIFTGSDGCSEVDLTSRDPDEEKRFDSCYENIVREAGKYLMFASHSAPPPALPPLQRFDEDYWSSKYPSEIQESEAGKVCSILSIVFGGVAFLLCPPLFGLAGLTLGIIGVCLSRKKALGVIGIALSVVGTMIGMIIGAALSKAL